MEKLVISTACGWKKLYYFKDFYLKLVLPKSLHLFLKKILLSHGKTISFPSLPKKFAS